ncbi:hypothetical protein [Candidatus Methylomirabilis sp.]|uniref:hypothetical protein n=1 Tax=Candidatus Methylomirabilis sp. TaxID=2032687 RepID=UPI003C7593E6
MLWGSPISPILVLLCRGQTLTLLVAHTTPPHLRPQQGVATLSLDRLNPREFLGHPD